MFTGASSGPHQVTVTTSGVTSISIQWDEVACVERNGEITGYSVRYEQSSSELMKTATISGNSAEDRMFSIDRLLIRTNYSFEVAAINSDGIGDYGLVTMGTTAVPTGNLL